MNAGLSSAASWVSETPCWYEKIIKTSVAATTTTSIIGESSNCRRIARTASRK